MLVVNNITYLLICGMILSSDISMNMQSLHRQSNLKQITTSFFTENCNQERMIKNGLYCNINLSTVKSLVVEILVFENGVYHGILDTHT